MVSEATAAKTNNYELIVIIRPDLADDKLEAALENVKRFITGKSGVISDVQRWGKRRLAYHIKHFGEGVYVLVRFQSRASANREIETSLRISDDVLRHLLVKTE